MHTELVEKYIRTCVLPSMNFGHERRVMGVGISKSRSLKSGQEQGVLFLVLLPTNTLPVLFITSVCGIEIDQLRNVQTAILIKPIESM